MLMTVTGQYGNDCWYTIQHLTVISTAFSIFRGFVTKYKQNSHLFVYFGCNWMKIKTKCQKSDFFVEHGQKLKNSKKIYNISYKKENESSITKENQVH